MACSPNSSFKIIVFSILNYIFLPITIIVFFIFLLMYGLKHLMRWVNYALGFTDHYYYNSNWIGMRSIILLIDVSIFVVLFALGSAIGAAIYAIIILPTMIA